jgi:putative alpha-1,2-mannosidase
VKVIRHSVNQQSGIKSIKLNGKTIPVRSITHQQLLNGGLLEMVVND